MKLTQVAGRSWGGGASIPWAKQYRLVAMLVTSLFIALISGIGLVYTKYMYRQYASDLHEAKSVHKNLQVRYDQLLHDYSGLNSQSHIRNLALEQGMIAPDQRHTRIAQVIDSD